MKLSIIIPAHNEEHRLPPVLKSYAEFFSKKMGDEVEIIVVVNGTIDGTARVAETIAGRYPIIRILDEPSRIGKGGAIMLGIEHASGEYTGYVDADGATIADEFYKLYIKSQGLDGAIASRWMEGSVVDLPQKLTRRVASRMFNLMTRVLFGLKFSDTQCGAKIFRLTALNEVFPKLGVTQWAFDVDLLFHLRRTGFRIQEFSTVWNDAEGSKVEVPKVALDMAAALIRLRLVYSPFKWIVSLYNRFLGPFISPPGMESDGLFRHSLLLMAAAQVTNVFNLVFQIFVMRQLTDSEYSTLGAMLSIFALASMSLGSLSRSITHYTALYQQKGDVGAVSLLLKKVIADLLIAFFLLFVLLVLFKGQVCAFLKISSITPVFLTVASIGLLTLLGSLGGVLQGVQHFLKSTLSSIFQSGSRLLFVVVLMIMGRGLSVMPILGAHAISHLLALALAGWFVISLLRLAGKSDSVIHRKEIYGYALAYFCAWSGFSILMNLDIIMAKHYFDAETAGRFAKVAILARMVIFLPLPVASALFPKVVSVDGSSEKSRRTLVKGLILVGGIVIAAAVMATLLAPLFLRIMGVGAEQSMLLRTMFWALSPLSFVLLLLNYELAQRRFTVVLPVLICAGIYLALLMVFHSSLLHIIACLGGMSIVTLLTVGGVVFFRPQHQSKRK